VHEPLRVFGVGAALLLVEGAAVAESRARFTFDWTSPAGCPTRDDVRGRAETLLGGPIEPRLVNPLDAQGRVTSVDGRFELHLETVDNGIRGERTLKAATCEELASAAALIIALAVDPETVAARSKDASTAAGAAASTSGAPPVATPPPNPSAGPAPAAAEAEKPLRSGAPVTGFAEADLAVDWGALPDISFGPSLTGGFAVDRLELRLAATYFAPRFAEAPPDPDRGGDVSLLVFGLAGCYALTASTAKIGLCAEFEGGALFAIGRGFDHTDDAVRPWLGAGGSVDLTIPVAGPVALRVGVGALFPFGRSPIQFTENPGEVTEIQSTIHRPFWVSGRAAAGVRFTFR
jgi:hypothetical protein